VGGVGGVAEEMGVASSSSHWAESGATGASTGSDGSSNSNRCTSFSGNCVDPSETILPRGNENLAYVYDGAGPGRPGLLSG